MKNRITRLLSLCLIACLMLTACGRTKTKTYTCEGLTIKVPANYKEKTGEEAEAYTFALSNNKTTVMGLREEKAILESMGYNLTLEDYAELIQSANANRPMSVSTYNDQYMILLDNEIKGIPYKYLASVYESEDAFWLIQFACRESDYEKYRGDFFEHLLSVNP